MKFTTDTTNVAVAPDGSKLYLSDPLQRGINVFDPATRETLRFIRLGFEPKDIGFTPDGSVAFVGCRQLPSPADALLINGVTDQRLAPVNLGFCPSSVAFAANNSAIYVSGGNEPTVGTNTARLAIFSAPFATSTTPLTPTFVVQLSKQPQGVALSPTAAVAYVAAYGVSSLNATDELIVVNLTTRTVAARIDLGRDAEPVAFQFNEAGTRLFVANRRANEVVAVDTATNTIVGRVAFPSSHPLYAGDGPTALLLSRDEQALLVARSFRVVKNDSSVVEYQPPTNGLSSSFSSAELHCFTLQPNTDPAPLHTDGATLSVVNTASFAISGEFTVGRSPAGIVMADQARSYFTASQCESLLSRFVASGMAQTNSAVADQTAAIATSPNGNSVYLVHPDSVSIVDAATGTVENVPSRGRGVESLLYLNSTTSLYAARPALGRVDVVNVNDVQTPTVASVAAGTRPAKLVADAAGTVYALNLGQPRKPGKTITRISGTTALSPLTVDEAPTDIVIDGTEAFVTSFGDLVPVITSVNDLRRGFGDRLIRIGALTTAPQVSAIVNRPNQDVDINGPLTLALLSYAGQRRLIYPNFGSFGVALYDPASDFGRTIPVNDRPIAARTTLFGGSQRALAYVLSVHTSGDASVAVIDIELAEANLPSCDQNNAANGCIVLPLAMTASDLIVGGGNNPVVLVTSFDDGRIALFRVSATLPDVGNPAPQPTLLTVGSGPRSALISANGNTAYVANELDGTVTIVDLATLTVATTLNVGGAPTTFTETPTGRVFVGHRLTGRVSVIENRALLTTITLPN